MCRENSKKNLLASTLILLFQITEFSSSINEELREIYPTISINKVELRYFNICTEAKGDRITARRHNRTLLQSSYRSMPCATYMDIFLSVFVDKFVGAVLFVKVSVK